MVTVSPTVVLRADLSIGDRVVVAHTLDVSENGAIVQTDEEAPLGARIGVTLSMSGLLDPPCALDAQLIGRRLASGHGAPATWELSWEPASGDDRVQFETLLETLRHGGDKSALRILLVEDSAMTRQVFELGVTRLLGHRIGRITLDSVGSGEAAVDRLRDHDYDIVIVDCLLPGIQGPELISRLREEAGSENIAVVAMSVGGDEVRRLALEAGADLFVHKPVVASDLLAGLERLGLAREQT